MVVCPIAARSGTMGALSEPSDREGKDDVDSTLRNTNWCVDGEQAGPLLFWFRSADRSSRELLNAQSVGMPGDATGPSLRAHQQGRLHTARLGWRRPIGSLRPPPSRPSFSLIHPSMSAPYRMTFRNSNSNPFDTTAETTTSFLCVLAGTCPSTQKYPASQQIHPAQVP